MIYVDNTFVLKMLFTESIFLVSIALLGKQRGDGIWKDGGFLLISQRCLAGTDFSTFRDYEIEFG